MFQRFITPKEFTAVQEQLAFVSCTDSAELVVTIGKHPMLGTCIAVQDVPENLILLSEKYWQDGPFARNPAQKPS